MAPGGRLWSALPIVSPLARRIVFINIIPLALLGGGLLYLGHYGEGLTAAAQRSLEQRAATLAVVFAEGAQRDNAQGRPYLEPRRAREIVRRLGGVASGPRIQIFNASGVLIADSVQLMLVDGAIIVSDLPAGGGERLGLPCSWTASCGDDAPARESGEPPPAAPAADDFVESAKALSGEPASALRSRGEALLLSAATPISAYRRITGALRLSEDDAAIAGKVASAREEILYAFLIALSATLLLSLYLSGHIAGPLRRLTQAAAEIREKRRRNLAMPALAKRRDEIGSLYATIDSMTSALQKRYDDMERFAADVAHEIKNPLSSLQSAVESIGRVNDQSKQRKLTQIISDDVQRIDRLISDIAHASQIDAGGARRPASMVDLRSILLSLKEIYEGTEAGERRISIAVRSGIGDFKIFGDREQLVQALRNLVSNAVSFSPDGEVVSCRLFSDAAQIRLTIEDRGAGISEPSVERIFERFYTRRERAVVAAGHSGLGLSIARQICEAHGGRLTAANVTADDGAILGARLSAVFPRRPRPTASRRP